MNKRQIREKVDYSKYKNIRRDGDLQRLRQELESQKKKLVDVFERAPVFMAILRGKDHIFEMANSSYFQLVGHRDIIGKTVREALPEVVDQGFISILDNVFTTGEPYTGKEILVTLNREKDSAPEKRFIDFVYEPITDIDDKITGLLVHGYDITEQVEIRKKIEESELQYRTLFNAIDEGFCVVEILFDTKHKPIDYRVLETNKVFEQQTGLVNAVGKTARELNLEQHWIETYGNIAVTGKSIRFTQGSDQLGRWFDVFATRVGGPDSPKVVIIFSDITKRRELERQKDDFMGIVSHELKTPVTSIKAFTQVLQKPFCTSWG